MCTYLCMRFKELRSCSQALSLYGVSALDALTLRTFLSSVIHCSAPGTFVHMGLWGVGASFRSLPVVAEFKAFWIDQVTFCILMTLSFGAFVSQELRCALVDGVTESAKAEGAGWWAGLACAHWKRLLGFSWLFDGLAGRKVWVVVATVCRRHWFFMPALTMIDLLPPRTGSARNC